MYTTTSSSEGTSFTCWLYDNGVLTNLGTLGGKVCQPTAMNDSGQIVGHSTTAEGSEHPFIYSNGRMTDIGVLSGASSQDDSGFAWAINSSGAVVGQSQTAAGQTHTFLYKSGQLRDIDPDALFSAGLAINDAGQITGVRAVPGGSSTAYRYQNGTFEDINAPGVQSSIGRLINRAGDIAGSITMQAEQHAFLFSGGALGDIGTLGGPNAFPSAMNDLAQIAGFAFTSGDIFHAMVARDGALVDLGSLASSPNDFSRARSINRSGHVVGWTATPDGTTSAFLSNGAGMQDLRALVTSDAPEINDALCINDAGQIAATGMVGGRPHAFLLTPASAATSLVVSPATVRYGDRPQLIATLTSSSRPVAQKAVTFTIDGVSVGTAATDENGVARLTATDTTSAGAHTLSAAFATDELYRVFVEQCDARCAESGVDDRRKQRDAIDRCRESRIHGVVQRTCARRDAGGPGRNTDLRDRCFENESGWRLLDYPFGAFIAELRHHLSQWFAEGDVPKICVWFDQFKSGRAHGRIPIDLCNGHGIGWWSHRHGSFDHLFDHRKQGPGQGMWDLLFSVDYEVPFKVR